MPNFLSLSVLPPPLLGGGGSCSRESLISAGPACSNTCYRVSLRSLAETSVAAEGGLWKGVHSGENCILVYNAKAVPPPVSGSCEPYFRPTLSAADNHAFSREQNKTLPTVSKKRISRLSVINNITQSISQQLPQLQSFETGSGGWAKDDFHGSAASCSCALPLSSIQKK